MNTMTTHPRLHLPDNDASSDPFHDPLLIGIGIAVLVVTLVMIAVGGIYYWGELYGAPSWGTNSFPPPFVY